MNRLFGKFLLGAAVLTCPCHLPIYLVLFGGTALGSYLGENQLVFAGALTILFLFSLVTGLRMIRARN